MKITDEILNKYLDGELNREEADQVKREILESMELKKKLNALKLIHDNLYKIKKDEVSQGFT